ncbi:hypothetical protein ABPG73_004574 [Tetrahymena malaccensis]
MFKLQKLKPLDFQLISYASQQYSQASATLQSVQYKCQIINNILNIHLFQNFVSKSESEYSQTIYYFPISEGICLESFEAKYNEKNIKAIVKEKDQAKQEYLENKNQGNFVSYAQTTSLQDQEYCQIELGNLPPGQQIEIKIVFSQQLNSLLNKYLFAHIPLVYCEDEVSAKLGKNVLTLDLFCTGKILYAESKGYPAERIMLDDNTARFNLSKALQQQNTDFQLIFSYEGMFDPQVIFGSSQIFSEDKVKNAILPTSHSAMVSFIPNFNEEITQEIDDSIRAAINNGDEILSDEFQQKLNQELVDHLNSSRSEFIFLLDRSGSMSGQPIRRACEALILFLKSLPNDSYFNVVSFGTSFENLFPSSTKYTSESLENAIQLISQFKADLGGTEIYNPLINVFLQNKIPGYNKQIFLLTDGAVNSPQRVVQLIKQNNKYCRVHSIGIGLADLYLIRESALAGKGIAKLIDQKCELSEVIISMLSYCITPTFDELKITYDDSIIESTYPSCSNFPCVFKDEIINIHFFFKPLLELQNLTDLQKTVQIEYYDSHKKQKVQKEIKLEMQDSFTSNTKIQESVFKIGKQLYLNENMLDKSMNSQQLIQQAIEYQLLTKKTALICVIETLNDEQKIMYQNLNHNVTYSNSQQILDRASQQSGLYNMSQQQQSSFFGGSLLNMNQQQYPQQSGLFGVSQNQALQQGGLFGNSLQQSSNQNNLFGNHQQQAQQQQTGFFFGQQQSQAPQQCGLFGMSQNQATQQGGLFGYNQQLSSQQNGVFGFNQQQNIQQSGLFGTNQQQPQQQGGLFGGNSFNANQQQASHQGSLFSQYQQQISQQGGLFGISQSQIPSNGLFGASKQQSSNQGGLFGSNQFNNNQQQNSQQYGLFSNNQQYTTQQGCLFGMSQNRTPSNGLFGASQQQTSNQGGFLGGSQSQVPQQTHLLGVNGQQTHQLSGMFGNAQSIPSQQGSLFGSNQQQTQQQSGLFVTSQQSQQGSLFGSSQLNNNQLQNQQQGSLLSNNLIQPSQQGGLFSASQKQAPQNGLFGASQQQTSNQCGLFGGGLFGGSQPQVPQQQSLFGINEQPNSQLNGMQQQSALFGTSQQQHSQQGGLFGSSQFSNNQQRFVEFSKFIRNMEI